jgi:hypothetical protein
MAVFPPAAQDSHQRRAQTPERARCQDSREEPCQAQAPPMPRTMRPVPSQFGQLSPRADFPLPLHCGQMSSPVPGVPGGASSPGLVRGGGVGCLEG